MPSAADPWWRNVEPLPVPNTTRAVEHIVKTRRADDDSATGFEVAMLANAAVDLDDDDLLMQCMDAGALVRRMVNEARAHAGLPSVPEVVKLGEPMRDSGVA